MPKSTCARSEETSCEKTKVIKRKKNATLDSTNVVKKCENIVVDGVEVLGVDNCIHDVQTFPDGKGYCKLCGDMFIDCENKDFTVNIVCKHENLIEQDSLKYCGDCGREISTLDFAQDWRWFGAFDNKTKKDPNRCHAFKSAPKGIKPTFEHYAVAVSPAMMNTVETKFNKILAMTQNKVLRGISRTSIIAVCLFYTYISFGEYRTALYVRNMFKLSQKQMSSGLKKYYIAYPEDRTNYVTTPKLIPWIMKLVGMTRGETQDIETNIHYKRILELHDYIAGSSQLIKRSNPQSIASALVYFYLCLFPTYKKELGLTRVKFAEKVYISDITIFKIVTDIVRVTRAADDEWQE